MLMENTIRVMRKISDGICAVAKVATGITMIILIVVVLAQIFLRWADHSLAWATEFCTYVFIWSTMLGSALACRYLLHIGVDVLTDRLPAGPKKAFAILSNLIFLAGTILFGVTGWNYMLAESARVGVTIKIPMAAVYVSVPICSAIMVFIIVLQILEIIHTGSVIREPDDPILDDPLVAEVEE